MLSKYMKKSSTFLAIKEMQVNRMAIFKGNNNNKCRQGCGKTETLIPLLVGVQISTTIMESSMEIPQKTKDRTAI
jgi:hypothetical protein